MTKVKKIYKNSQISLAVTSISAIQLTQFDDPYPHLLEPKHDKTSTEQNKMHLCVGTQELQERYRLSSAPKIGKVHLCVGTQELQERYR